VERKYVNKASEGNNGWEKQIHYLRSLQSVCLLGLYIFQSFKVIERVRKFRYVYILDVETNSKIRSFQDLRTYQSFRLLATKLILNSRIIQKNSKS
jgi:hypothetical protein